MTLYAAIRSAVTHIQRQNMGSALSYITGSSSVTVTMADTEGVLLMAKGDKVVIFSKSYCPYCKLAKEVFQRVNQNVTVFELDQRDDGAKIQKSLEEITGVRTVPQVFVNGNFIGGGSDVDKMEKAGSLRTLLN